MNDKKSVIQALKHFGAPIHSKGFDYLTHILTTYEDAKKNISQIYAETAEQFGVSSSSVERDVRTCGAYISKTATPDLLYELFGNSLTEKNGSPQIKNAQLINALFLYLEG